MPDTLFTSPGGRTSPPFPPAGGTGFRATGGGAGLPAMPGDTWCVGVTVLLSLQPLTAKNRHNTAPKIVALAPTCPDRLVITLIAPELTDTSLAV
jgi:hypothetical protein